MTRAPLSVALLLLTILDVACTDRPAAGGPPEAPAQPPPYDFARPDTIFNLPPALLEISGLSMRPDGRLAAIFDEDGILFTLDPTSGAVVDQRRFNGAGDYEGVEVVDSLTWILRSNGSLHAVPMDGGEVEEFNTALRAACDAEGLGYDPIGNDLLIACKENPGPNLPGVRAIYAFDLDTRELSTGPVLLIHRSAVDAAEQFKSAAIAVHPETRRVYVLSSVRKALLILNPRGPLESVTSLPAALYPQPEGIAFAPDGTLYISNEGVDGPATLMRFSPRP